MLGTLRTTYAWMTFVLRLERAFRDALFWVAVVARKGLAWPGRMAVVI
jgi:hypothetical protein